MIVTDSRTSDPVRPVFLTFDGEVAPGEPFAHMVANKVLNGALRRRAAELGIDIIEGVAVSSFETGPAATKVHLADGVSIETRLLVAADGVNSRLRDMAGIKTVTWEYGQSGIVCTVAHERPHNGRAEEHFLPAGPFAILPLTGRRNRSSIVWTERTRRRRKAGRRRPLVFEVELEQRFGLKLGEISVEGKPRAWPLGLTLARAFVAHRVSRWWATPRTASIRSPAKASTSASRMRRPLPRRSSRPTGSARISARSTCWSAISTGGASTRCRWASRPTC